MFPKLKCLLLLTVIVLVHLFQPTAAQDDPSIALLRQEKVKQSGSAKPGAAAQNFAPLTDGKTDRMLEILLQPGNPLDILYHLPAVATCQQLVISADTRKLHSASAAPWPGHALT